MCIFYVYKCRVARQLSPTVSRRKERQSGSVCSFPTVLKVLRRYRAFRARSVHRDVVGDRFSVRGRADTFERVRVRSSSVNRRKTHTRARCYDSVLVRLQDDVRRPTSELGTNAAYRSDGLACLRGRLNRRIPQKLYYAKH